MSELERDHTGATAGGAEDHARFPRLSAVARALQIQRFVKRIWMPIVIVALSLSGVAVAADALVVTASEEIDDFVDEVTRPRADQRLDGALTYVAPDVVACRLSHDGSQREYNADAAADLTEAVREALNVFDTDEQSLLQHAVRIDGDRASVTTRMGDPSYEQTVIYELVRRDNRWLVRGVRVL